MKGTIDLKARIKLHRVRNEAKPFWIKKWCEARSIGGGEGQYRRVVVSGGGPFRLRTHHPSGKLGAQSFVNVILEQILHNDVLEWMKINDPSLVLDSIHAGTGSLTTSRAETFGL